MDDKSCRSCLYGHRCRYRSKRTCEDYAPLTDNTVDCTDAFIHKRRLDFYDEWFSYIETFYQQ